MKKILVISSLLLVTNSFANNEAEEFFYQRGLDAGFSKGYQQGVKDAFEEAKKILAKYKNEIRAYEVGKYFLAKGYITYPKIYQRLDDMGNLKIEVEPSRIEKQLNIGDIFAKFNTLPENPNPEAVKTEPLESRNSVYIPNRDNNNFLSKKAEDNQKILRISIERSGKNEEILKKSNLVYSVDKDRLKVMFFNRTEKNNFCNQFKICD